MLTEMDTAFGKWWNLLSKVHMMTKDSIARSAWNEAEYQSQSRIAELERFNVGLANESEEKSVRIAELEAELETTQGLVRAATLEVVKLTQRLAEVEAERDLLKCSVQEFHMAGEINGYEKVAAFIHSNLSQHQHSLELLKEENEQALADKNSMDKVLDAPVNFDPDRKGG